MSVIVAVKENGVVYMGADSQTTAGNRKCHNLNQTGYKIARLDNGRLVGFCGRVATAQIIRAMQDVFTLNGQLELTKEHIVKKIIPKLADKMELLGDEQSGDIEVSILLAHSDKIYMITDRLDVVHLNEYGKTGAGSFYVDYVLQTKKELPPELRILRALSESAKREESVSGPFVLIDTKKLEYVIADMGGENH